MKQNTWIFIVATSLMLASASRAADIGTAFTYQGSLENPPGTPMTGSCDFEFRLFSDSGGAAPVGIAQAVNGVTVSGGVFTVGPPDIDFGDGAFNGEARWMKVSVCCPNPCAPGSLQALSPLVELAPAPYSLRAREGVGPPNALEVDTATGNVGIGMDAPLFPLHVSTASVSGRAVYGEHTAGSGTTDGGRFVSQSTDGRGVFGWTTANSGSTRGVYGRSSSTDGRGVFGWASANSGTTSGVYGESNSTFGRGVYGEATAATGPAYGGWFESASTSGLGVYGEAAAGSGATYGVYGQSASTLGTGVYGEATAGSGTNYGGRFKSSSTDGRGVYGEATAAGVNTFGVGVSGRSDSTSGRGVYAESSAGTGVNYGVYATSASTSGRGVFGEATAISGTTYGVRGDIDSPDGFASYFTGPSGSKNYFQQRVGIGTTVPDVMLHVDGGTEATHANGSGYLVVGSLTSANIAMDGDEIVARNNGGPADLILNNLGGGVAIQRTSADHPLHVGFGGTNGNGAHLTAGGTWTNGSSRDFKQGFEPIDKQAVLRKVVELPVTRWQYKGEADDVHHIGPVAQDFRAAFDIGHDERYITTIDADGVALAAIQGLHQIVQEKDCEIGELGSEISNLKSEISELRSMVKALVERNGGGP